MSASETDNSKGHTYGVVYANAPARAALDAGARGVVYGRNVWQAEDPVAMCGFLREVIHRPQVVLA